MKKAAATRLFGGLPRRLLIIPAMTDFRARGTIMGLAGLTAVFGMGTGVAPPVWSPEKRPAGGQAGPDAIHAVGHVTIIRWGEGRIRHCYAFRKTLTVIHSRSRRPVPVRERGSAPIGVVKLLGC